MRYDGPANDFVVSEELADVAAHIVRDRKTTRVREHPLYGNFAVMFEHEIGRAPRKWLKRGKGWFSEMDDVFFCTGSHPDVF